MSRAALLALLAFSLGAACTREGVDPMKRQLKFQPFQQNSFFDDERAMRMPVEGTVPREKRLELVRAAGNPEEGYGRTIPVPVDEGLLALGRKGFDITCATCHGVAGDGDSIVARQMSLAPPPSLHTERLRQVPDGYLYFVASHGYGMMPAYADALSERERWAVVAWVRVLQLSQHAPVDAAPADVRQKLESEK